MIAWYSPAKSSFNYLIICTRVIFNPVAMLCFFIKTLSGSADFRFGCAQASTVKPTLYDSNFATWAIETRQ
jgi:hypothetical protein